MQAASLLALLRSGKFLLLQRLGKLLNPFYHTCFLSSLASSGLLPRLAQGPAALADLAVVWGLQPEKHEALAAWLEVGVKCGDLSRGPEGYSLAGRLARKLAKPACDPEAALLEEVASLHYDLIRQLPARLKAGRAFTLADLDGEVVARSSRVLEPLITRAMDALIPQAGKMHLLDAGCGSGGYIGYACRRNPELTAVGVELDPEVAEAARRRLADWGLAERVEVVAGDIRSQTPQRDFDLVTLHNNIYYFPVAARPGLLALVRRFLKPGGRLLLTTGCKGGGLTMAVLDLWGAATQGCGPLPRPEELAAHLREAGFTAVKARNLYSFEAFYAFVAAAP